MTVAGSLLIEAARVVSSDRRKTHGEPERVFSKIAAHWSIYLDTLVTPVDVCEMMVFLKMERGAKKDDCLDAAGYAALAYEVGLIQPEDETL